MQLPVVLLKKYLEAFPLMPADIHSTLKIIESHDALVLDGPEHFNRRRKMIAAVATENFQHAFERYVGESNLLPINYLQIGYFKSRAVGRIQFFDLELRKPAVATGFLISHDLVITNHHVFAHKSGFRDAEIAFNYEYDLQGREKEKIIFQLDPEKFFHAYEDLDLALIGVLPQDKTGNHLIDSRGYLVLNGNLGKAGLGDYASIIQHAEGQPMQIALRENKIIDNTLPDALVYSSDTSHGSSGSPVFNDEWQVIALHSAGVAKTDEAGNYIDKDEQIIPEVNGRVDASKLVWISNRGTRVSAIMHHLLSHPDLSRNPFIMHLTTASYTDDKELSFLSMPQEYTSGDNNTRLLPPATEVTEKISPGRHVFININIGEKSQTFVNGELQEKTLPGDQVVFEKKLEDEIDFSVCRGFDEYFLGRHTPLPTVSAKLKKQLAFFSDNPDLYVLKYHHYSTMQHAIRKMPVTSAVNITTASRFQLGRGTDRWFRDRRIDLDVQLNDEFYKKSGFDKGHMTRREDAEWGDTIVLAGQAADYTCAYTNACPQVPDLNRAVFGYEGKWGKLELELLEKAVLREQDGAKISVYNGPVFSEDDPVYKGIQVPMLYWKIVVWRNAAGKFKTTGFLLSQQKLVTDIPFEELHVDLIFKRYQCSINHIEKLSKLKFSKIRNWDTYIPPAPGEEEVLIAGDAFERFIIDNRYDEPDDSPFI
jgi:endonuclease G